VIALSAAALQPRLFSQLAGWDGMRSRTDLEIVAEKNASTTSLF
jgi:hypothetical protein